jgi:uncharacterized protein YceH (UPF0502 family)
MTNIILNAVETRVLGSLIEKQITTPEYYPLTLNALTNACNQKNNRDPVLDLEETSLVRAIDSLREKKLVSTVTGAGIRVPKYKQSFDETFSLNRQETAIMCVLFLRGPQTTGELRSHTGSMYAFGSIDDVEKTITALMEREIIPLVRKLPRQPGQKEQRFIHLLTNEAELPQQHFTPAPEQARRHVVAENERITQLEKEATEFRNQIHELQKQFNEFKKQFE